MSGASAFVDRARLDAQAERADDSLEAMNWDVYEFLVSVVNQSWTVPEQNEIDKLSYMPK